MSRTFILLAPWAAAVAVGWLMRREHVVWRSTLAIATLAAVVVLLLEFYCIAEAA